MVQAINKAKVMCGKKAQQGDRVEMNNFQNPQVRRELALAPFLEGVLIEFFFLLCSCLATALW